MIHQALDDSDQTRKYGISNPMIQALIMTLYDKYSHHLYTAQRPTLPQLINFHNRTGERINIMQRVGTQYTDLGLILLNDKDGSIVEQITSEYQLNAVNIMREILKRWIRGEGKQPVTWKTLTDTLTAIGLTELVKSIQESL